MTTNVETQIYEKKWLGHVKMLVVIEKIISEYKSNVDKKKPILANFMQI